MLQSSTAVFDNPMPAAIRAIGGRFRDGRRSYRMTWGELALGKRGWACELCLFSEWRFSFHVHVLWVNLYVSLPFLARFAWEPDEMVESWGLSYAQYDGCLFLRWGSRSKLITMPWRDWQQVAHDVRRPSGAWVPFVGSWERGKEPDHRQYEAYPYRYLLSSGEVQERTATVSVERRTRRLRWLRWTSFGQRVTHAIDVAFEKEVGEGTGSWKGGCTGCGYELRSDETPRECLKRMERERRFAR